MTEERNYTLYMHTNLINDKKYIGITSCSVKERWGSNGRNYIKQFFYYAIKKYGWNNFKHEVLLCNLTREQAEIMEIALIKYYNTTDRKYGYNIEKGGNTSLPMSEETKRKLREINLGRKKSDEEKMRNSIAHIGMNHTEETKIKISNTMKEKHINKGNNNPMYGKKAVNAKQIICDETGIIFDSIMETAKVMNLDFRLISAVCRGKRHTTGGYHFRYYED